MAYINTYNTTGSKLLVQVFPSARRVATQSSARMFSEKSIVEITNKLIDTDGFVLFLCGQNRFNYKCCYK